MTAGQSDQLYARKSLRLWPGILLATLVLFAKFVAPLVSPDASMLDIVGGIVGAVLIFLWWILFSRAPWPDRLGVIAVMALAMYATSYVVHESISNGMMGMMLFILGIPVLSLALVASTVAARNLSSGLRRASIAAAIVVACGSFALLRTGGLSGGGQSDLHWRWTPTPEERLLAQPLDERVDVARNPPPPAVPIETANEGVRARTVPTRAANEESEPAAPPVLHTKAEWPGFRGPDRDSIVSGVRIETDWTKSPPVELWRKPIGPGWSSFAVHGDLFYTQEQRGDEEIVACYRLSTGEPVWRHRDQARFWESNGGAGPRATPTLSNGRVYAFGATGILNALDERSGGVIWSHDVASDTGIEVPEWGFASSPLVVDDVVIVAADATLIGYDAATGRKRWVGPAHRGSYSSPHRTTIDGVDQVVLLGGAGATSVVPGSGAVLWEYDWPGTAIVQPALMADGNIVINSLAATGGLGTRRVAVAHRPDGWSAEERWTSTGLKPYFNDLVIHRGYAFGFDGSILASINLDDGKRVWKGGRYGNGQIVLLPDQDLLLVLSEDGDLALVNATPDEFKEIARVPALQGKTWNHPALVGDVLLVRNGEEMAAFRLSMAGR